MKSYTRVLVSLAAVATAEACTDTINWSFTYGGQKYGCSHFDSDDVCLNGKCMETSIGKLCGEFFNFPELNCCVCGKPSANGAADTTTTTLISLLGAAGDMAKSAVDQVKDASNSAVDVAGKAEKTGLSIAQNSKDTATNIADTATQTAKGVAADAKDMATSVAKTATDATQGVAVNAKDQLGLTTGESGDAKQVPLDSLVPDKLVPMDLSVVQDMEPAVDSNTGSKKKSPGFFTIFMILVLVGSVATLALGCYYGYIPSLSCRKHVPCDEGYERIPTTVGQTNGFQTLYRGEAASDITSWSYGATSGQNIAA